MLGEWFPDSWKTLGIFAPFGRCSGSFSDVTEADFAKVAETLLKSASLVNAIKHPVAQQILEAWGKFIECSEQTAKFVKDSLSAYVPIDLHSCGYKHVFRSVCICVCTYAIFENQMHV
jgi:hypothetical protein